MRMFRRLRRHPSPGDADAAPCVCRRTPVAAGSRARRVDARTHPPRRPRGASRRDAARRRRGLQRRRTPPAAPRRTLDDQRRSSRTPDAARLAHPSITPAAAPVDLDAAAAFATTPPPPRMRTPLADANGPVPSGPAALPRPRRPRSSRTSSGRSARLRPRPQPCRRPARGGDDAGGRRRREPAAPAVGPPPRPKDDSAGWRTRSPSIGRGHPASQNRRRWGSSPEDVRPCPARERRERARRLFAYAGKPPAACTAKHRFDADRSLGGLPAAESLHTGRVVLGRQVPPLFEQVAHICSRAQQHEGNRVTVQKVPLSRIWI